LYKNTDENSMENEKELFNRKFISTGLPDLDKLIGGLIHSELVVIASDRAFCSL
jgi:replicative DNA helicase